MNGTGLKGAVDAALQRRRKMGLEDWLRSQLAEGYAPGAISGRLMNSTDFYVSEKSIRKWISDLPVSTAATE